jgi:anti-anti-sigma factor
MQISTESVGGVSVVTARGRLDGAASGAFAERVQTLIDTQPPRLLIDFAGIDFVTSAGLRAVLTILKKVKAQNGSFALCNVQKPVHEVLDISGFAAMMSIHPDRASALRAMG